MATNLCTGRPQRGTTMFLIVLAIVTSAALLTGCSSEIPVAPGASIDAPAANVASPVAAKDGGLTLLSYPEDFPGAPLYVTATGKNAAALGFGALLNDGEWVAIPFEREPDCVPGGYNLLGPPNIPAVFGCQLTTEGKGWFSDPEDQSSIVKAWQNGLGAVPIYFVLLSEYEAAIGDGVLTIGEFEALPSLVIGYASYHREVLNFPFAGRPGSHDIISSGELEGGGSFQLRAQLVGTEWGAIISFD